MFYLKLIFPIRLVLYLDSVRFILLSKVKKMCYYPIAICILFQINSSHIFHFEVTVYKYMALYYKWEMFSDILIFTLTLVWNEVINKYYFSSVFEEKNSIGREIEKILQFSISNSQHSLTVGSHERNSRATCL